MIKKERSRIGVSLVFCLLLSASLTGSFAAYAVPPGAQATDGGNGAEDEGADDEEDDEEDDGEDSPAAAPVPPEGVPGSNKPVQPPSETYRQPDKTAPAGDEGDDEDEQLGPGILSRWLGLEGSAYWTQGWIESGIAVNSTGSGHGLNFGVDDSTRSGQFSLNQLYWIFEKRIGQQQRFDWGFRFDNLVGTDWSVLHADALLTNSFSWSQVGWDPVQFYGQVYLPFRSQGGIEIKAGRFYALQGFEEGMAPYRPLYSTSYLYNFARPATYTGILTTWPVSDHLEIYNGVINSPDLWLSQGVHLNYAGGVAWESEDERTKFETAVTVGQGISRQFAFAEALNPDAVNTGLGLTVLASEVLIHDWTDRLSTALELDEGSVSGSSQSANLAPNGNWFGAGAWLTYDFNDTFTGLLRFDTLRDRGGTRTGFDGTFHETTLGLNVAPTDWLRLRPEVRYDWASGGDRPYDGQRSDQITFGIDLIFQF